MNQRQQVALYGGGGAGGLICLGGLCAGGIQGLGFALILVGVIAAIIVCQLNCNSCGR